VLTWNAGAVFGAGTTNIQLKVQAQDDLTLLGDWSSAVDYTVNAVNTAPVLGAVGDQTVDELKLLTIQLSATDADLPANKLTFGLVSGPSGLTVSADGLAQWTPTEAQGPSTNLVTVKVTDDGTPALSATNSFSVTVMEVNSAPVLAAVGDQTVDVGRTLRLRAAASDPDIPPNNLTLTLDAAPQDMVVDAVSGEVIWTPAPDYLHTTNVVVLRVTDDGEPRLTATMRFTVAVPGMVEVRLGAESYSAGRVWLTIAGPEGITIALESSTNLAAGSWTEVMRRALDGSVLRLDVPLSGSQSYYRAVIVSP
jgi:hypothetical protein